MQSFVIRLQPPTSDVIFVDGFDTTLDR